MKICHIVDNLGIGGLERTIVAIVLNLKGYEHEVWCLKKKGVLAKDIEDKGIKVREFNFEGGLNLFAIKKLTDELRKEKFDIVHSHGLFPFMWGELAAILAGIPVRIVHCQNSYDDIVGKNRLKFRIMAHFTTKAIAVSKTVKLSLLEIAGVNPEKIVVIYNSSSDMSAQDPNTRIKIRKDLGLNDTFVIGSVGRIEKLKGYSFLIEAVSKCKKEGADCKCLIVGDGPEKENLKRDIQRLKLDDTVIMPGWRQDIADLLSAMDVFVLTSLLREGLPLALAEAASAGLPLIATPIGGNPEIVEDEVNGFIVPVGDPDALAEKLRYLMKNTREMVRMGENSKKVWREKFTLKKMINEIGSLYRMSKR